ncbi:EF-P beta-lysylation protein EpmB [Legionella dresdenensis]|uniref:L-lysine 2,3-aminomutase n=1 Tax=Legionella dresdenensis TaxID=450200 RepID=A0ABV8CFU5_9GAMM
MRDSEVSWQKILAQGFANTRQLLQFLNLPEQLGSQDAEQQFKTRVPRGFARRMMPGNPHDPLLLQVLATDNELVESDGYNQDPLDERSSNAIPGLLHKYNGRLLLTVTGACAVNCRYCFRRHFPYQENNPGREGWQQAIEYISQHSDIHEVIFSGGDPLLASDAILERLISRLAAIPHLKTLRIHTRIPVVLPERINAELIALLSNIPLQKVIVLHCNHAQEIDHSVKQTCDRLRAAGCTLLNQSVLLKNINDCPDTLADLSRALFDCGVLPYYLHVLDKVTGAAHFDLPTETAQSIHNELQQRLPGYLVPRLAREEAGKKSKTLL